MIGSDLFLERIRDFINEKASTDKAFALKLENSQRTVKDCVDWMLEQLATKYQKTGQMGYDDEEIFDMVVQFFDSPNLRANSNLNFQGLIICNKHAFSLDRQNSPVQALPPRTVPDIFISYSRDDKTLVHPFVEYISNAVGKDCWIDLNSIESGEEFEEVIMKAIDECQVVLFMLSDSSLASKWTKREVYYAESEGKRIVPVIVNGEYLRGWFRFHFGNVDYININSEEQKKKLVENLRTWLG